jgi:hypothetical protein
MHSRRNDQYGHGEMNEDGMPVGKNIDHACSFMFENILHL